MNFARIAFFTLLLGLASPCLAETHVLASDGSGDFSTIQAAIDAAVDGDEIVLGDGAYVGPGNVSLRFMGKAITLRSASGNPEACVLFPNDDFQAWGIRFDLDEGPDSVVEGIGFYYFQCGLGDVNCGGRAITAIGSSPTIRNVRIENCHFFPPGVILLADAEATIEDLSITQSDGGIESRQSLFTLTNSVIEANSTISSAGAGIMAFGSTAVIRSTRIVGNRIHSWGQPQGGAGVFASDSDILIEDSEITDNTSPNYGGAILLSGASELTVRRSTIAGNHAAEGGGIYAGLPGFNGPTMSNIVLENTILRANCAGGVGTEDASFVGIVSGSVDCSSIDTSRMAGFASLTYGTNSEGPPLFCAPRSCSAPWDERGIYTLQGGSQLLDFPGCGRIGLYGAQCAVSVEPLSWGEIKSKYR